MKRVNKKRNTKSRKGGAIIGVGGHGCVFRPSIACKDQSKDYAGNPDYVSKVMDAKESYEEIYQAIDILNMLNKNNIPRNYFSIPYERCPFNRSAINREALLDFIDPETNQVIKSKRCELLEQNIPEKNLSVLQSRYGGQELETIFTGMKDDYDSRMRLSYITVDMLRMLNEAIIPMNHAGIWHCDLKPQNVLVSNEGVKMIDWGMMRTNETRLPETNRWPDMWNGPLVCTMLRGMREIKKPLVLYEDGINFIINGKYDDTIENENAHIIHTIYTIQKSLRNLELSHDPKSVFNVINRYQESAKAIMQKGDTFDKRYKLLEDVYYDNVDKWGFVCCFTPLLYHKNKDVAKIAAKAYLYLFSDITIDIKQVSFILSGLIMQKVDAYNTDEELDMTAGKRIKNPCSKNTRSKNTRSKNTRSKNTRSKNTRSKNTRHKTKRVTKRSK